MWAANSSKRYTINGIKNMARIRTVKPEFWTSEQVAECSPTTRLLFIGMWNFCDDGGNHVASLKQLKMQIFPSDDISIEQISCMVDELIKNELITQYVVNNKNYWHVLGWHHQKIEKPNYKHPAYSESDIKPFAECSPTTRLPVDPVMEGSLKECNVINNNKQTNTREIEKNEQAIIDNLTSEPKNFEMYFGWKPNQQEFLAYKKSYGVTQDLTPEILEEFIRKAHANKEKHNETKWCNFLAKFLKSWINNPTFEKKPNPHIYQPEQQYTPEPSVDRFALPEGIGKPLHGRKPLTEEEKARRLAVIEEQRKKRQELIHG